MRHLIGLALALVLAAAVFFGATWGYLRLLRIPVVNGATSALPAGGGTLLHDKNVLLAVAALAGVGLLAGLLVACRGSRRSRPGCPGWSCSPGPCSTWRTCTARCTPSR